MLVNLHSGIGRTFNKNNRIIDVEQIVNIEDDTSNILFESGTTPNTQNIIINTTGFINFDVEALKFKGETIQFTTTNNETFNNINVSGNAVISGKVKSDQLTQKDNEDNKMVFSTVGEIKKIEFFSDVLTALLINAQRCNIDEITNDKITTAKIEDKENINNYISFDNNSNTINTDLLHVRGALAVIKNTDHDLSGMITCNTFEATESITCDVFFSDTQENCRIVFHPDNYNNITQKAVTFDLGNNTILDMRREPDGKQFIHNKGNTYIEIDQDTGSGTAALTIDIKQSTIDSFFKCIKDNSLICSIDHEGNFIKNGVILNYGNISTQQTLLTNQLTSLDNVYQHNYNTQTKEIEKIIKDVNNVEKKNQEINSIVQHMRTIVFPNAAGDEQTLLYRYAAAGGSAISTVSKLAVGGALALGSQVELGLNDVGLAFAHNTQQEIHELLESHTATKEEVKSNNLKLQRLNEEVTDIKNHITKIEFSESKSKDAPETHQDIKNCSLECNQQIKQLNLQWNNKTDIPEVNNTQTAAPSVSVGVGTHTAEEHNGDDFKDEFSQYVVMGPQLPSTEYQHNNYTPTYKPQKMISNQFIIQAPIHGKTYHQERYFGPLLQEKGPALLFPAPESQSFERYMASGVRKSELRRSLATESGLDWHIKKVDETTPDFSINNDKIISYNRFEIDNADGLFSNVIRKLGGDGSTSGNVIDLSTAGTINFITNNLLHNGATIGGSGGSQTPWTQDINANQKHLNNLNKLIIEDSSGNNNIVLEPQSDTGGTIYINNADGNLGTTIHPESFKIEENSENKIHMYINNNIGCMVFYEDNNYAATLIQGGMITHHENKIIAGNGSTMVLLDVETTNYDGRIYVRKNSGDIGTEIKGNNIQTEYIKFKASSDNKPNSISSRCITLEDAININNVSTTEYSQYLDQTDPFNPYTQHIFTCEEENSFAVKKNIFNITRNNVYSNVQIIVPNVNTSDGHNYSLFHLSITDETYNFNDLEGRILEYTGLPAMINLNDNTINETDFKNGPINRAMSKIKICENINNKIAGVCGGVENIVDNNIEFHWGGVKTVYEHTGKDLIRVYDKGDCMIWVVKPEFNEIRLTGEFLSGRYTYFKNGIEQSSSIVLNVSNDGDFIMKSTNTVQQQINGLQTQIDNLTNIVNTLLANS